MRPVELRPETPVVRCTDIAASIAALTDNEGYRLEMIMPADNPRVAELSRGNERLRLQVEDGDAPDDATHIGAELPLPGGFVLSRAGDQNPWLLGRAGMHYRDLIPGRLGGRYIGSHIRIPEGGPVADYVHYHQVRFQMIYCLRGWVRVVYEDQGPPFVLRPGDCVLQPPTIRHRVLEASAGLEVIEVGGPAEHPTFREHVIELPTAGTQPARRYGGQAFVHHVAADARWLPTGQPGLEYRDSGISDATNNMADVRVLRPLRSNALAQHDAVRQPVHDCELFFLQVLAGELVLDSVDCGAQLLATGDSCVVPAGAEYSLALGSDCEVLQVSVRPGESAQVETTVR